MEHRSSQVMKPVELLIAHGAGHTRHTHLMPLSPAEQPLLILATHPLEQRRVVVDVHRVELGGNLALLLEGQLRRVRIEDGLAVEAGLLGVGFLQTDRGREIHSSLFGVGFLE